MTWQRIDQTHWLRNPEREEGKRVYGWFGKLWPRLALTVQRESHPTFEGSCTFHVWCATKPSRNRWWETRRDIPCALLPEFAEMVEELRA